MSASNPQPFEVIRSQIGPQVQYREIPVITNWRQTDSINTLRSIMQDHERGMFLSSALFVDEVLSDDRISGVLDTRISGLLCADLTFTPSDDRKKSAKLARLLGGSDESKDDGLWWKMADLDAKKELLKWKIMLGVAVGQIVWDTNNGQWLPRVVPWHPRNMRWNMAIERFQLSTNGANSFLTGNDYNVTLRNFQLGDAPDGKWFIWGQRRSWMTGAIRYLGQKYVDRQWNERDWSRYCEKHGIGIIEGKVPSGGGEEEKERFLNDLRNIGNETTMICPQAPAGEPSYGIQLHEATAKTWETFQARKHEIDTDIAISLLGQNLTTEVKGGSLAAASIHEGIRIDKKRADAELYRQLREQVLIPWVAYNFKTDKPDSLAPYPTAQINPPEDNESEGNALSLLGDACAKLGPLGADVAVILETHGVPMKDPAVFAAEQAEQKEAAAKALAGAQANQEQPEGEDLEHDETNHELATPEAKLTIAMLKANGPAAMKRVAKYHDAIVAKATRSAASAMGGDLDAILSDIEAATSPDDLKRRVYARFKKMKGTAELAAILRRTNMLANLVGRVDVIKGG
jgi:phage gp29-like protein